MNTKASYHRLTRGNTHLLQGASVFDNPVDTDQLANFQADDGHELVFATIGIAVIGFASGTVLLHPNKQPDFLINEVAVDPEHQRQGIARRLCNMLIGIAHDRECKSIWLATEEENVAARAPYRGLDAREKGSVVVYDWDGSMEE